MSSTAPTKKPYRKAPPQHCEVRHEPPGAREEVPEQLSSQVMAGGGAGYQRTCFSRAEDADSEGVGKGRPRTLLRRVKSLRAKGKVGKSKRMMGLRRFLSHSEENIAASVPGKPEGKSRSLERSLVFKEPAEVLSPKKAQHRSRGQPLKGILKQPGALRSPSSLAPSQAGSPSPDRKTLQDRSDFSRFLDEITSRVLSPTNLQTTQRTDEEAPHVRTPEGHGRRTGHRRPLSPGHPRGRRRSAERRHELPLAPHSRERCHTPPEPGYLDTESLSSTSQWSPEGKSPSPRASPSLTAARNKVSAPITPKPVPTL
ncbi:hypothetical protein GDO81_027086 [Engystomops pustulosus]|uniref:Uncharacterized protein n=1 Tax=Engystomops pustulosus TaxID=76066 RepID=A0AAV6YGF2_ENGPU|nr:hypothetical protein GDO81_027086 [Engystomops pustulosus]